MLGWEACSILIQVSAHITVDRRKGRLLANMESNRIQGRKRSSELEEGVLTLLRDDLAERAEEMPCWGYVTLGKLFTSVGLFGVPQNDADDTCPVRPMSGGEAYLRDVMDTKSPGELWSC